MPLILNQVDLIGKLILPKGDILIKPRLGSFGLGILKISNKKELLLLYRLISQIQKNQLINNEQTTDNLKRNSFDQFDIQNLVSFENSFPKGSSWFGEIKYNFGINDWLGTTIIGKKAIYGYRKHPSIFKDGWRVTDPLGIGGHVSYVSLSLPLKNQLEKAAEILNMDIIGFDLIKNNGQWKIIDENCFPGLYLHCFKKTKTTLEKEFYRAIVNCVNKKLIR